MLCLISRLASDKLKNGEHEQSADVGLGEVNWKVVGMIL